MTGQADTAPGAGSYTGAYDGPAGEKQAGPAGDARTGPAGDAYTHTAGDAHAASFGDRHRADVVASFARTPDPRLREIMQSLVRHLHGFVTDVGLTEAEWATAIGFLTDTGQASDDRRQEFVILSDVLGVSTLVETINNRAGGAVTESTVLGPFHVGESPVRELGAMIGRPADGEPCLVTGRVTGPDGEPLPGATVDVWQASAEGFYDVQQPGEQPRGNLRGLFTADDDGEFRFRTIVPRFYPIPVDGPVGALLTATRRHPNRPAHIHFIAAAGGHLPVTTHLFVADTPYLDSDPVFGVKPSLVRAFAPVDDPAAADAAGLPNPYRAVRFDIGLRKATEAP